MRFSLLPAILGILGEFWGHHTYLLTAVTGRIKFVAWHVWREWWLRGIRIM